MDSKFCGNVNMMDRNFDNFLYRRLSAELVNASGAGDLKEVTRLIEEYRVKAGHVLLLLNRNSDVLGRTALHAAADHGKHSVLLHLLNLGAKQIQCATYGMYPLHYCARSGRKKCIITLLERGGKKNAPSVDGVIPIELAREYRKHHVEYLFKDPPKRINRFEATKIESWQITFSFEPPENDGKYY